MEQALAGIKILDFSKWLPGQYCSMVLGDFGADIIKIEDIQGDGTRSFYPVKEEGMSYWHLALNRNKKGMALNLRSPEGQAIVKQLASEADVILEGFRPGFMAKCGLDYASLAELNPKLVYCSITGFGQTGKFAHKPAHDMNVVGLAGMTYLDRETGGATVSNIQFSAMGGAMSAVNGVLLALLSCARTGKGQYIDIGMYNVALSEETTIVSGLWGAREQGIEPFSRTLHYYNIYPTKDGRYLTAGVIEPKFWIRMCQLIEREDLIPRQMEFEHREELEKILTESFQKKTLAEWLELIGEEEFCVTPICTLEEAMNSELTEASDMVELREEDVGMVRYLRSPIKLSSTPGTIRTRAPYLGEHTEEILSGLGYSQEQIAQWQQEGIVK